LKAQLDSAEMKPDRAQELKRLVDEARPFDQPSTFTSNLPDDLHYQVTIEHARQ
jgi:emfourin